MTTLFIKYAERLKYANWLIHRCATGSPKQFAKRLNISESHLYNLLEELRLLGMPLAYSKTRQTYYYTEPLQLRIEIVVVPLSEDEEQTIEGGLKIMLNYSHSTFIRV